VYTGNETEGEFFATSSSIHAVGGSNTEGASTTGARESFFITGPTANAYGTWAVTAPES
jgi:hypothetical protein